MELVVLVEKTLFLGWAALSVLTGVAFLIIGVADIMNSFRGVQLHVSRGLRLANQRPGA